MCRAWVPPSRYHLFGEVDIWVGDHDQFSDFIGHLDHPLCTFAPSVRELRISTGTDDPAPLYPSPDWADPLIPYLGKLMSVKTLSAHAIGRRPNGWEPLFKSVPFVTQITHLSLQDAEFMTFEECMDTIHSFSSLESLEYFPRSQYDYSYQQTAPSLPAFPGSPPSSLRTLQIESFCTTTQLICQWFHRSQTRLSVIKLGGVLETPIPDNSAVKLSTFTQYLQFLGPSLEVLQADFQAAPTLCGFLVDRTVE